MRLRSDEQLVALFRDGHDEAFRVIYDRYRQRLFAYTRQMLPGSRQDAEDALQDVFVRAYSGLRANNRELTLRAWLYRVAHNRCIDEIRRPPPPPPEVLERLQPPPHDLMAEAEQRESLRRLIEDLRRLPDQQRSALLMRELEGMKYTDMAEALAVSVPAVKSLLVRARVGLAQAVEARDTACSEIRAELIYAHDRGVRPSGMARRHMHDCAGCREFRGQMRTVSKQVASLVPALGPLGLLAKVLGIGGGAGGGAAAGSSAAAGSGAAAAGGAAAGSGGVLASAGALAGSASHVATLLAAAVVTAGGAVVIQHSGATAPPRRAHHHAAAVAATEASPAPADTVSATYIAPPAPPSPPAAASSANTAPASSSTTAASSSTAAASSTTGSAAKTHPDPSRLPGSPSQGPTRLNGDLTGSPGTGPTTPAGAAAGSSTGTPATGGTEGHPETGAGSTTGTATGSGTSGSSTTGTTTSTTPSGTTATTASAGSPTGTSTTPSNPQH